MRARGRDWRLDSSALGQATHLAARLEPLAPPGRLGLTAEPRRLAAGMSQGSARGPVAVAGRSPPVAVFAWLGAGPPRRRLQGAAARGLTRFVGRHTALHAREEAWERAGTGQGPVMAGRGEPGLGKSRLLSEGIAARGATRAEIAHPYYLALMAEAYGQAGLAEEGLALLTRALATVRKTGERWWEAELYRRVAGLTGGHPVVVTTRPFRAPHHTISAVGVIGGGQLPVPREVSLTPRGLLFLDELPECTRHVLEVLRPPLEDGLLSQPLRAYRRHRGAGRAGGASQDDLVLGPATLTPRADVLAQGVPGRPNSG